MTTFETAKLFKAISEPPRVAILHMLAKYPDTLTVAELIEKLREAGFEMTQPTFSHHLKILRRARLVTYRDVGRHYHYYSICPEAFAEMREALRPFMGKVEVSV